MTHALEVFLSRTSSVDGTPRYYGRCSCGWNDRVDSDSETLAHRMAEKRHLKRAVRPPDAAAEVSARTGNPRHPSHVTSIRAVKTKSKKVMWTSLCTCGWRSGALSEDENDAVNRGRRHRVEIQRSDDVGCPTPDKTSFRSQRTADQDISRFWRTSGKGKKMPVRSYRCVCGKWHTTSRPAR